MFRLSHGFDHYLLSRDSSMKKNEYTEKTVFLRKYYFYNFLQKKRKAKVLFK
jgi:hypothetical protein